MPLIPIGDLRVTLGQILHTDYLPDGGGIVAVSIDGERVERHLTKEEMTAYTDRVIEITSATYSRS